MTLLVGPGCGKIRGDHSRVDDDLLAVFDGIVANEFQHDIAASLHGIHAVMTDGYSVVRCGRRR